MASNGDSGRNAKRRWSRRKIHKPILPQNTPTELEWADMTKHAAADISGDWDIGTDSDSDSDSDSDASTSTGSSSTASTKLVRIRKGDDVIMLCGDKVDGDDIWLGHIESIRSKKENDVWVRVYWYWSSLDLSEYIKSFDTNAFAPRERAHSDNVDIVPATDCIDVTYVHEYDETDLDPPNLGPSDFFVRSQLFYKRRHIDPRPGALSCICFRPYNPFPKVLSEAVLEVDTMHFCPRSGCRRWYHRSCLLARGHIDRPSALYNGSRGVRLLAGDPDQNASCAALNWYCESYVSSDPHAQPEQDIHIAVADMSMSIAHLPPALVAVAQFPIVRRPGPRTFGWSAVGNVSEVVLARRFMYAAFEGMCPGGRRHAELGKLVEQADELERRLYELSTDASDDEGSHIHEWDAVIEDLQTFVDLVVGGNHTLLASPYEPYWNARQHRLEEEFTAMAVVPVLCPESECRSAI
ncbi:hypothetical protein CERSUDRAFT_95012 [Gelatoporia subvermispora B]|uniref:BAH domain-containing protein n=1 Tax=Ceriporiopsis subvermispora (strain B) TaxID=914234 RepID=M2PKB8_CERS8|nr:hypothetical protein CERSUDRAFT_95012 [Gelatoporia subvermispora B]